MKTVDTVTSSPSACYYRYLYLLELQTNLREAWSCTITEKAPITTLHYMCTRAGGGSGTFFSTHGNHLPWLSGVHGLKDFLWSDHLHESFGGRIYSYGSVLKSKFVHQRTHEDGHSRENPSNHELLTVRGGDCRASKKMFRGLLPPYSTIYQCPILNTCINNGKERGFTATDLQLYWQFYTSYTRIFNNQGRLHNMSLFVLKKDEWCSHEEVWRRYNV